MYKINAHNISGVRSWALILIEWLQWPMLYVCFDAIMCAVNCRLNALWVKHSPNVNDFPWACCLNRVEFD